MVVKWAVQDAVPEAGLLLCPGGLRRTRSEMPDYLSNLSESALRAAATKSEWGPFRYGN